MQKRPSFAGKAPLFNLGLICARPKEEVWFLEGEACAEALAKIGLIATTSGGVSTDTGTDLTPLAGRKIVIWPDNDEHGAEYGERVANALHDLGCNVEIVKVDELGLSPKGDCVDWLRANAPGDADAIKALPRTKFEKVSSTPCEAVKSGVRVLDLHEFLGMELPIAELILPWMRTQSLCMVHAWRGVGKTHFALSLAYAVASGSTFMKWTPSKARRVLYIDGEMPGSSIQERLARIVQSSPKEAPVGYLQIVTPDLQAMGMPDLATEEGQRAIDQIVGDCEVIVVDNLSCLVRASGKENDAESWIKVQEWALRHRCNGRSILFVHHSGKSGSQRGTSKKEDVLDVVICLKRPANYSVDEGAVFEVHFEKARHFSGDDLEPFEARLEILDGVQRWRIESVEETTYQRVLELHRQGLSRRDIADELDIHKSTISRHMKRGASEGLISEKRRNAGKTQREKPTIGESVKQEVAVCES